MIEYRHQDGLTHISLDDGKVNALGTVALADLNAHLDHAMRDDAVAVIITGRECVFSAGFDLKELRSGDAARESLRRQLIDLALRIFSFERPVIVACSGHALAAGAALLLAADRRIGLDGPFSLGFTEAKLGVSLSPATVELARYRMPMPWFESLATGDTFSPSEAQRAGLLDVVVEDGNRLSELSRTVAEQLSAIPRGAFLELRRLARAPTMAIMRAELHRLSTSL